jgi:hypothetical protein
MNHTKEAVRLILVALVGMNDRLDNLQSLCQGIQVALGESHADQAHTNETVEHELGSHRIRIRDLERAVRAR